MDVLVEMKMVRVVDTDLVAVDGVVEALVVKKDNVVVIFVMTIMGIC